MHSNSNIFHNISPNGFLAAIIFHLSISTSVLRINVLQMNIVMFSCMLCIILYTHQQQTCHSTATMCIFVQILPPRPNTILRQLKNFWQCLLQSVFHSSLYLKLLKIFWKCPGFFLYTHHFQRLKCVLMYVNKKSLIYYHFMCTDCFLTSELKSILELYFLTLPFFIFTMKIVL